MAASLLIEEESGTYTGRIRHAHNGYYAGNFSQTTRSSELSGSRTERRDVPRAQQWWRTAGADPSVHQPAEYVATGSMPAIPAARRG